jgi:hypothetical protein
MASGKGLLGGIVVLALATGIFHLFWASLLFQFGDALLGTLFVGMGIIYLVGVGLTAANVKRDLWYRVGAGYVALLLVAWAYTAAFDPEPTAARDPLAFLDKVVEVVLLVLLVLAVRGTKASA